MDHGPNPFNKCLLDWFHGFGLGVGIRFSQMFGEGLALLTRYIPSPTLRPLISRQNISSLLKSFIGTKNLKLGKALQAQLTKTDHLDTINSNHLINFYAKCGDIRLAHNLFDAMPERNAVSCGALMAGYFHEGSPLEALSLLKSVDSDGTSAFLNEYVLTTALASCSDLQALEEGKQCHAHAWKSGLLCHSYVRNSLLNLYSRCGSVEDASKVFESMREFDVFACNSLINGYLEQGHLSDALDIVQSIVPEVLVWDLMTYLAVFSICSDARYLNLGNQVHCHVHKRGMSSSEFVGSAIIDMYGKCSDVSNAKRAFDEWSCRNVVSWTAFIAVCAQNDYFEEALKLFLKMGADGLQPTNVSYAVALNSCAGLSFLKTGDALHVQAEKSGNKSYLNVRNALINMYTKSGSIDDARRVFMGMICKDIISWNSIIAGYSHHGLAQEALDSFDNMLREGMVPSYVTFVPVLSACAHLGLLEKGIYYVDCLMKELGIRPGIEHHTCMVGLLCRAGKLDEAQMYMQKTNIEWDIVAWRTLLTACQVHKNFSLGWQVAEQILQLNPNDVGTYILLSNMYAKANRWDGVVKVRKLMKCRDMKKEPGVSWTQVRNETHVFSSEDKKHPMMNQIIKKLKEFISEIKILGYVPNIASVLHDVEEEQKEEYLIYHSEKLAIAFALISLPPGAPIHVIKNLRMCDDCHVAVKLLSTLTRRKIVVRDVSRFHCFEVGSCSCDDYW